VAKETVKKTTTAKNAKPSPATAEPKRDAPVKAAAPAKAAKPKAPRSVKAPKAAKVPKAAKPSKTTKSPPAAEVVAATLVAAAAALRNPKRAQALALEAADDIKRAAKSGVDSGEALWKLALDVARRSIDALGPDKGKGKKGKKGKK